MLALYYLILTSSAFMLNNIWLVKTISRYVGIGSVKPKDCRNSRSDLIVAGIAGPDVNPRNQDC